MYNELMFMSPELSETDFHPRGEERENPKENSDSFSWRESEHKETQQSTTEMGTVPHSQPVESEGYMDLLFRSYPCIHTNPAIFNNELFQGTYMNNRLTLYLPSEVDQLEIIQDGKTRVFTLNCQAGSNPSSPGSNSSRHYIAYLHEYIMKRYRQLCTQIVYNNGEITRKMAANVILFDIFGQCDAEYVESARKVHKECPPEGAVPMGRLPIPSASSIENYINRRRGRYGD